MNAMRMRERICRLTAALLCLCLVVSAFAGFTEPRIALADAGTTAYKGVTLGVTRQADPSTMDDYLNMLDFSNNTRYAGRLWSDKSVFAYDYSDTGDREKLWNASTNTLTLDESLDGVDGTVTLDADFLHVYSVLGSSQGAIGVPPVRTVIVFDNSGSMYASDDKDYATDMGASGADPETAWKKQRIAMTIEAINKGIDTMMLTSQYNEVAVVLFGDGANSPELSDTDSMHRYHGNSTAVTILPMKHYEPSKAAKDEYEKTGRVTTNYTHYLKAGWNNSEEPNGDSPNHVLNKAKSSGWVFVDNVQCGLTKADPSDAEGKEWYPENPAEWNGWNDCGDRKYTCYSNGTTNIQAGYYVGMQELLRASKTEQVGSETYQCVPSLVMLTDGQTTDMMAGSFSAPELADEKMKYPQARGFVNDTGNKLRSFTGAEKDGTTQEGKQKEIGNFWDMFVEIDDNNHYKSAAYYDGMTEEQRKKAPPEGTALENMEHIADTYSDSVASMILGTLMTTAYFKAAVKNAYNVEEDWNIYTISVDMTDPFTIPADAVETAKDPNKGNVAPLDELPDKWVYNITSNAPTMNPAKYFVLNKDEEGHISGINLQWLKDKGYIETNDALSDANHVVGYTAYPNWSVGEMILKGIVKAANTLQSWSEKDTATTAYQAWSQVDGIFSSTYDEQWDSNPKVIPCSHSNGYLLGEEQKVEYPNLDGSKTDDNPYALTKQDVIDNIEYDAFAYYPSTANGSADDLMQAFVQIFDDIMKPLFNPVAGTNDLGVADAVTYMDPVGKYMDVKDVKNLVLFDYNCEITKTAVYDYRWNHQYMVNEKGGETTDPITEGWYKGDPEATEVGNKNVEKFTPTDTEKVPEGSAQAAWDAGWVYRLSFENASMFVPTLKNINDPDANETVTKMRNTEYTFYRIDKINDKPVGEDERRQLHVNPAYLKLEGEETEKQAEERMLKGITYTNDGQHLKTPGVYALSDLRIWVEDSGDFSDTDVEGGGVQSDTNFDEALWINIPSNMLPLRTVTVDLGKTGSGTDAWTYTSKNAFPLRVFYTVGVSEDVLEDGYIDMANDIDAEYTLQNKVTDDNGATARKIDVGNVEFFANWYNPLNRYDSYATTNTDYTFGDPVTTFSPAPGNRYYMFEKALPLYKKAYRFDGSSWVEVTQDEASVAGFGGRICAVLDGVADKSGIADKLNILGIVAQPGEIVLLENDRLGNVDKPKDEAHDPHDPFSSTDYFFLPIEYYELNGTDKATWTQYAISRRGSEFGSAYETAHITNGDMLCWHDMSGRYTQDYPYLSYTETSTTDYPDSTRGRDFIGYPIDSKTGYYVGCDKDKHETPASKNFSAVGDKDAWNMLHEQYVNGETAGDWVVCAKPGGLRVGGLAQSVQAKGGAFTGTDENAAIEAYFKNRYLGSPEKVDGKTWGYYDGNTTRTANNYYVPTISNASAIENSGVKVNVYLGNNGRLYVMDTTLLVTKLYEPPAGSAAGSDDYTTTERFNYQIYFADVTDNLNPVVVHWNPNTGSWQRQYHYIDLQLDGQLFLQTQDGAKAMVDANGKRVVPNPNNDPEQGGGGYVYADADANGNYTKYEGTLYYVYIGKNKSTTEIGATDTAFRVYHNQQVDNETVSTDDVQYGIAGHGTPDSGTPTSGEAVTFYATTVYLVSKDDYDTVWNAADSRLDPVNGSGFDIEYPDGDAHDYYDQKLSNFELLTLDPNASAVSTEISIVTPYETASSYWTKTVTIGVNANADGDGKQGTDEAPGATLVADDLYDQIIPKADNPSVFRDAMDPDNPNDIQVVTLDYIAEHTAEFSLGSGEALLFNSLPNGTHYRVTEKLTDAQRAAGYALKQLSHIQQAGSSGVYRPGIQQIPIYTKAGATYGSNYGSNWNAPTLDGLTWPTNSGATETMEPFAHTNAIMWEYYVAMAAEGADSVGSHHHRPDSTETETAPLYNGNNRTGNATHTVQPNQNCTTVDVPIDKDGNPTEKSADIAGYVHFTYRDGALVDQHYDGERSAYLRSMMRYLVMPTVHFAVEGETQDSAETSMPYYKPSADYTGVYSAFGSTGTFETSANFVNTLQNDKRETAINGDPDKVNGTGTGTQPGVQVNDTISYEIRWANPNANPARVVIIDPLDEGVDFVEASAFDGHQGICYETKEEVQAALNAIYGGGPSTPQVDYGHAVIWDLGTQDAGKYGAVTLTVQVNRKAAEWWDYDGDGVADEPVEGANPPDNLVRDRATVRVANNTYNTNTVENPLEEKTEVDPGNGIGVTIGQEIVYEIHWWNDEQDDAWVEILDELDPGVDFVSAWIGGADQENADGVVKLTFDPAKGPSQQTDQTVQKSGELAGRPQIVYAPSTDPDVMTVQWNVGRKGVGTSGVVSLRVRVNERAKEEHTYKEAGGNGQSGMNHGTGEDGKVIDRANVTVGNESKYTNIVENPIDEKREITPGNGESVTVGGGITYEIDWRGDTSKPSYVIVMDTLDPGVAYVASDGRGTNRYYPDGGTLTFTYHDGGEEKTATIEIPAHTVVWDIGEVGAGEYGTVTLSVQVDEDAFKDFHYVQTDPSKKDDLEEGDGNDDKVVNRAKVVVDNRPHFTNIVENPLKQKRELSPGEGEAVGVGSKIEYEIDWQNSKGDGAWVVVFDPLDPGVDYVSHGSDVQAKASGYVERGKTLTLKSPDNKFTDIKIPGHTVYWDFGIVNADAAGKVTLTVEVNENATLVYNYNESGDGFTGGEGTDNKVTDEATVVVNNEPQVTNEVQNPLKEKQELTPGEGEGVKAGDTVTYQIDWKNSSAEEEAYIVVTDTLDPGVDLVSAEWTDSAGKEYKLTTDTDGNPVETDAGGKIKYYATKTSIETSADGEQKTDVADRTVVWTIGTVGAGASGHVTLTVRVNEKAKDLYDYTVTDPNEPDEMGPGVGTDYRIVDRAKVFQNGAAHFTNPVENPLDEKTETSPGDGVNVKIGDPIEYEIHWKNEKTTAAYLVLTDTLDKGVDLVSAEWTDSAGKEYKLTMEESGGTGGNAEGKIRYYPESDDTVEYPLAGGPKKGETAVAERTVLWDIGMVNPGDEVTVKLTVKVNDKAPLLYEYTETHPELPDNMRPGSEGETDYKVLNRAKVIVDNEPHFTNIVENPLKEKRELTPGEGEVVGVGRTIDYEIDWRNSKGENAWVVVFDPLDPGVDHVDHGSSGVEAKKSGYVGRGETLTLKSPDGDKFTDIEIPGHTVYWDFGLVNADAAGKATLTVKVNENAKVDYNYNESGDGFTGGTGTDNKVTDEATVVVSNEAHITNEVQNPLNEKKELTPGEGEAVKAGDTVTYQIDWKNSSAEEEAYIVVTDTLDPGVDLVSAEWESYVLTMGAGGNPDETGAGGKIKYYDTETSIDTNGDGSNNATVAKRTVAWSIGKVAPGASGHVTLTVRVNESAKDAYSYAETDADKPDQMQPGDGTDYRIVDRAKVIENGVAHYTNEVDNPLKEKEETSPGDGVSVRPGEQISYSIDWAGLEDESSYVVVTDTLDPGVDLVSAEWQSYTLTRDESGATGGNAGTTIRYYEKGTSVKTSADGSKTAAVADRTVVWDIGTVGPGASGKVTLTVRVKDDGEPEKDYDYGETDPKNPDKMTGGTGKDNQVVNRAKVTVNGAAHYTNKVDNPFGGPDKTETKIDRSPYDGIGDVNPVALLDYEDPQDVGVSEGDLHLKPGTDDTYVGPRVFPGDRITYEISWENYKSVPAAIVIRDPLDPNVKFVSASFYWTDTTDSAGTPYTNKPDGSAMAENLTLITEGDAKPATAQSKGNVASTVIDKDGKEVETVKPVIAYTYDGKTEPAVVEWHLGVQPAGSKGKVRLIVQVLSTATPVGYVDNWAYVRVNGDPEQKTRVVENPTPSWQKEEKPYDEENKENLPFEGDLVQAGDPIHYEIEWYNDTNGEQIVTITDPLDKGVDFTRAWYGDWRKPYVSLTAEEAAAEKDADVVTRVSDTLTENGTAYTVTITYDKINREVTWKFEGADGHSGMPGYSGGYVDLDVTVNEKALDRWVYLDDGSIEHTPDNEESADKDHQVVNRAKVEVGKVGEGGEVHYTPVVDNPVPEKTEPDPGPDKMVSVGQTVTYNVHWENRYDEPARVIITDPLDDGADFLSASFGKVTLKKGQTEIRGSDKHGEIVITYDPATHTVVWTLENRPAGGVIGGKKDERPEGSYGDVELQITVNDKAYQTWTYEEDRDAGKAGEGNDYQIVNRARVQVGDRGAFTSEIENPVPDKQEKAPGADQTVAVGQSIVYEIYWKNGHDEEADVLIEDTLDVGLTFKSASHGGVYDKRTRTVTWKLPDQPAKGQGHVTLTVTVNEHALEKGIVENTALVRIGRDPKARTRVIRNPTEPKRVPEIPMTGDESTPGLWAALALLCAATMAGMVTLGKRKRDK